ncbi:HAUS augmin-like complex subunit 8 isoform X1 [Cyanistes caeruleus]|uniref:HAUS augmin like complex subunit 8 n=1 Tax=Cyanistes caeruleus TaxID=156563 RepID=A0A8C0VWR3_CYACU|nr:HAUS augmin-like complex subunit 8 isoform X1 [Cyanistes caeruleus]XP_023798562.1 HAUS augmin-like complex subunit 8 isoform X1 [Cyanistes caeruleus]
MSSEGGDMAAGGQTPKAKRKGGRVVQSRYLHFDKKDRQKVPRLPSSGVAQRKAEKDASSSSSSSNTSLPSSRTKARSDLSQKHKTNAGVDHSLLNQSGFEKGDLQSTLLDEEKMKLPDLDISAINDKSDPKKSSCSESASEGDSEITKSRVTDEETASHDLMAELESETLLLTFLRIKAEKSVAKMEEKAEKNLLMLCEEKRRQQEKLWELKREILLEEREQKLNETLDKQIEVLSPLVAVCEQFKEQYKSFAASLDATRHELPIKNIHIEGDKQTYLDELRKQLMITQELLTDVTPNHSGDSAKALNALKDLKVVSQELSEGLQRSFTDVQNLSFETSKEVSLHNQYVCEENHGVDVVKRWYFS